MPSNFYIIGPSTAVTSLICEGTDSTNRGVGDCTTCALEGHQAQKIIILA